MNPDVFACRRTCRIRSSRSVPDAAAVLTADDFDPVAVMSNRPEPDHARIRRVHPPGLLPPPAESLEDYIRERATALLDRMIDQGPAGRIRQGAGVPAARRDRVPAHRVPAGRRRDAQVMVRQPPGLLLGEADRRRSRLRSPRRCSTTGATAGRSSPSERDARADDFCSELLDAHDADPDPAIAPASATARSSRSCTGSPSPATKPSPPAVQHARCLLPRATSGTRCRRSRRSSPTAVEETLRFESSQISWRRITTQPTTLGGSRSRPVPRSS